MDALEVKRLEEFEIAMRTRYHKDSYPYPFLAMRHYNKNLKEEDQYKVYQVVRYESRYYQKVGIVQLMEFKARPKSRVNLPNSSSDDVPTMPFLALAHQMPDGETHVADCQLISDPQHQLISDPWHARAQSLYKIIPVCCKVCKLADEAAFKEKSRKLREEAKAQNLSEDDDPKAFFTKSYHDYGFSDDSGPGSESDSDSD